MTLTCQGCGTQFHPGPTRGGNPQTYCTRACNETTNERRRAQRVIDQLGATLGAIVDQDWRRQASCAGTDPDMWFPPRGDHAGVQRAKAICHDCPVRAECLTDNIDEVDGIFGGTTAEERKALRRWLRHKQGAA